MSLGARPSCVKAESDGTRIIRVYWTSSAVRWFNDLVSLRAKSMIEIAKREKVSKNYIGRLIRLAFLAPEVVDVILEGRQSPDFTVQALMTGRVELPLDWGAQKKLIAPSILSTTS